jgi:Rod binding domain-containing protein
MSAPITPPGSGFDPNALRMASAAFRGEAPAAPAAHKAAAARATIGAGATRDPHTELKHLAQQLEGVFLNQLFQAMRASVPQEGMFAKGEGEEMFTSMLDQTLAQEAARHMESRLSDALYKQLVRRLDGGGNAAP